MSSTWWAKWATVFPSLISISTRHRVCFFLPSWCVVLSEEAKWGAGMTSESHSIISRSNQAHSKYFFFFSSLMCSPAFNSYRYQLPLVWRWYVSVLVDESTSGSHRQPANHWPLWGRSDTQAGRRGHRAHHCERYWYEMYDEDILIISRFRAQWICHQDPFGSEEEEQGSDQVDDSRKRKFICLLHSREDQEDWEWSGGVEGKICM